MTDPLDQEKPQLPVSDAILDALAKLPSFADARDRVWVEHRELGLPGATCPITQKPINAFARTIGDGRLWVIGRVKGEKTGPIYYAAMDVSPALLDAVEKAGFVDVRKRWWEYYPNIVSYSPEEGIQAREGIHCRYTHKPLKTHVRVVADKAAWAVAEPEGDTDAAPVYFVRLTPPGVEVEA